MTIIFGDLGSNELPFLKSLPENFRYVLGLHEGAAVGMTDGYVLASGKPAFVNLYAAAGTGNGMDALISPWYSHSPLMIATDQQVRPMIRVEAMLANVDATQLPKPLMKWSYEPANAQDVPRVLSHAIHYANTTPKVSVYLLIPYDDWGQSLGPGVEHLIERNAQVAGAPDAWQLQVLVQQVQDAHNPVLALGPDVDAVLSNDHAMALADKLRMPVWIAPSVSRCPSPTRHPSFRGMLPAAVADINKTLQDHGLIIVVGVPVFRCHQFAPGDHLPVGAQPLHITSGPLEAIRAPVSHALVGDIRETLRILAEEVVQQSRPYSEALAVPECITDEPYHLHPEALFSVLGVVVSHNAIYVKESTSTTAAFWRRTNLRHPDSYYFPAAGGLDFGLPAAVGV